MYQPHDEVFEKLADDNVKIWRYMDFVKFIDLIDKKALFFSRLDRLPDPFEGKVSEATVKGLIEDPQLKKLFGSQPPTNFFKGIDNIRRNIYVNCWHINPHESAAMWKIYLNSQEGIAIQSTYGRLKKSFDPYTESEIYIGKVKYIDYKNEQIDMRNCFYPCLHKRKSFEYEQEIRAAMLYIPKNAEGRGDISIETPEGIHVSNELGSLIEKVYIAPEMPKWKKDLLNSVLEKYGISKEIISSSILDERPDYY